MKRLLISLVLSTPFFAGSAEVAIACMDAADTMAAIGHKRRFDAALLLKASR